jgi:hypothetical protein
VSENAADVFFYGLFMDPDALRAKGLQPRLPRKASVLGMALRIGARATLVKQEGGVAHGVVMALSAEELKALYAEPGVAAYQPEPVAAKGDDGTVIPAICYNLPHPEGGAPNAEYAAKLRAVAAKMGLPDSYIRSIR